MKDAKVTDTQALTLRPTQEVGEAMPASEIAKAAAPITAAQAKVEAVANLTMKAYEQASTLKLTPEEVSSLQADFPDEAFKPGAAGKENLIYIEHAFLRDRLNQVFGPGQWSIIPRNRWAEPFTTGRGTEGSRVYVEAMLVIRGAFVAEAVGAMEYYPKNESQNYGDAVEGAKTAALRRCAKELGIGLQAWKQDWCNGWWARRKKSSGNAPRSHFDRQGGMSTPPQSKSPQAQAAATPGTPSPKTITPQQAIFADSDTRARMIVQLKDSLTLAHEFFVKAGCILETEKLEDLPLRFVPVTRRQFQALQNALAGFGNGEEALLPYAPNPEAESSQKSGGTLAATTSQGRKSAETNMPPQKPTDRVDKSPSVESAKAKDPEWFWDVIISVPRKGMKKGEYDKHPDTVGSLYNEMKQGDKDAQSRLWGLVHHWDAVPREVNGKVYQPSEADKVCRQALDAFADYEEKYSGEDSNPAF